MTNEELDFLSSKVGYAKDAQGAIERLHKMRKELEQSTSRPASCEQLKIGDRVLGESDLPGSSEIIRALCFNLLYQATIYQESKLKALSSVSTDEADGTTDEADATQAASEVQSDDLRLQAAKHAMALGSMTRDEYRREWLGLPPMPSGIGDSYVLPPKYVVVRKDDPVVTSKICLDGLDADELAILKQIADKRLTELAN